MLRTRLWMGATLIALTLGVLLLDNRLRPWYPFLFVLVLVLTLVACHELLQLLAEAARPSMWLCHAAVAGLLIVNWLPRLGSEPDGDMGGLPWEALSGFFACTVLVAFVLEMAMYRAPGGAVLRIALTVWVIAYLGLLPSFLVQLRWLSDADGLSGRRATTALALAIFVPKCCDIGAYFTGRLLGRHPMAPTLSPKKTWEGAVGGLTLAILVAVLVEAFGPAVQGGFARAGALGLSLGIAGMLGDLAESLIKRDCGHKDASQAVPGFGGVLDVVDSIVFAAPVAYWWLR